MERVGPENEGFEGNQNICRALQIWRNLLWLQETLFVNDESDLYMHISAFSNFPFQHCAMQQPLGLQCVVQITN